MKDPVRISMPEGVSWLSASEGSFTAATTSFSKHEDTLFLPCEWRKDRKEVDHARILQEFPDPGIIQKAQHFLLIVRHFSDLRQQSVKIRWQKIGRLEKAARGTELERVLECYNAAGRSGGGRGRAVLFFFLHSGFSQSAEAANDGYASQQ